MIKCLGYDWIRWFTVLGAYRMVEMEYGLCQTRHSMIQSGEKLALSSTRRLQYRHLYCLQTRLHLSK